MYYVRANVVCIRVCVRSGSPSCTCLSVGMNVVMHSTWAQASVRLSVCLHARASIRVCMGMSVCLCWIHACIHVGMFKRP